MKISEAKARLLGFVAGWKEAMSRTTPKTREKFDWRCFVTVLTACEGLAMLEMLPDDSTICFSSLNPGMP